ncbi:hypothetical protein VPH35_011273 [Triticum aestivum]
MFDVVELVCDVIKHSRNPNVIVSRNGVSYWNAPCILQFIRYCSNGHAVCSECKPMVHNCRPTSMSDLGNIRCLALEKVGASLEVLYKFQNFGCLGIYPYYCKRKHESECQYRPYTGPHAGFRFFLDLCDGILICQECIEKMQHDLMFEVTALQGHRLKFATTNFIPPLCSSQFMFGTRQGFISINKI